MLSAYLVVIFIVISTGAAPRLGIGHNADADHVADVDAFQPHGRAHAQAAGVIDIRAQ